MALKISRNKKHVFWQAFFLTLLFFSLGLVFGVYMEQMRNDNVNLVFYGSEVSLYDSFALGKLVEDSSVSCKDLIDSNVNFADKIYGEAKELDKYDRSTKLTDSLRIIHQKYDLLRTLLWMNIISVKEKCGNINTVVYLYNYKTDNIEVQSKQVVWGRILEDLKDEMGNKIILIPLAVDQKISSLNYLIKKYNITEFPAVIINEKKIIYKQETVKELEKNFN